MKRGRLKKNCLLRRAWGEKEIGAGKEQLSCQ